MELSGWIALATAIVGTIVTFTRQHVQVRRLLMDVADYGDRILEQERLTTKHEAQIWDEEKLTEVVEKAVKSSMQDWKIQSLRTENNMLRQEIGG